MFRFLKIMSLVAVFSAFATGSNAQLPANPWTAQPPAPNNGYFGDNIADAAGSDITDAPIYANNNSGGEILPVDPWARSRDRSGVRTWRGSGQQGKLNYIGEGTTFNTGDQEYLAPEVNRHNMVVMLDHLRKMGYQIPESYNQKVQNMPAKYREKLQESVSDVQNAQDPFSDVFVSFLNTIENATGLSFDNILFNTVNILGTD
ncbi:MAG TPA: hypothetical protein DIC64_05215 [Alphaproteobacteria bacterium]|nr:hypothetical protein [Alphaproteobacteria bacterium]